MRNLFLKIYVDIMDFQSEIFDSESKLIKTYQYHLIN